MIDDTDSTLISKYKWNITSRGYAYTIYDGKPKKMHTLITGYKYTDHINGNKLDNRRDNLRSVTHSQNMKNRKKHINNKSGYKGVYWCSERKKWVAQIRVNRKRVFIGRFDTTKEAAKQYNIKSLELHGVYGRLNNI